MAPVLMWVGGMLLATSTAWAQVTVTAAWDRNTDSYTAGYRVFVGVASGAYPWSLDVGNATSAPLTLDAGQTYYVVVRAYNPAGDLGPPSNEAVIDLGAPGVPTGLSSSVAGSRVTLAWGPPGDGGRATNYLLYVGTAPGASDVAHAVGVGNVLTASGDLAPGRYYARVQAANSFGAGSLSGEISFAVGGPDAPTSPTGLSATWQGTVVTLRWNASAGASGYVVEAGSRTGSADVGSFAVGGATTYSVDVPPGTFFVRVRGVNAAGISGPSNEIVVQGQGAPNAPTALSASGSGSAVNLRWTAPGGAPPTGYLIEAGSATGLSNLGVLSVGPITTFSTTVPPGTYYVRVRAVNQRGAGPPSNEVVVRR